VNVLRLLTGTLQAQEPNNRWKDELIILKQLNMPATASKIGKYGMIWCRRPKPMQDVVVNIAAAAELEV
jgi:hypothetical protein